MEEKTCCGYLVSFGQDQKLADHGGHSRGRFQELKRLRDCTQTFQTKSKGQVPILEPKKRTLVIFREPKSVSDPRDKCEARDAGDETPGPEPQRLEAG